MWRLVRNMLPCCRCRKLHQLYIQTASAAACGLATSWQWTTKLSWWGFKSSLPLCVAHMHCGSLYQPAGNAPNLGLLHCSSAANSLLLHSHVRFGTVSMRVLWPVSAPYSQALSISPSCTSIVQPGCSQLVASLFPLACRMNCWVVKIAHYLTTMLPGMLIGPLTPI
jgi:hypothetical protein